MRNSFKGLNQDAHLFQPNNQPWGGTASTKRHCHRANRRRAPGDYPLGPSTSATSQESVFTQAIRAVQIGSFDLMIMKKNKITDYASCNRRLGYDVVCPSMSTREVGGDRGGVCLTGRSIELTRFHGTNMVI